MAVQALSRHNDSVKYLLTVIDVFSKFLHMFPLKSKSGKDVSAAFQSVLKDPRYLKHFKRRPVWVRTDKGKEFLNESFQKFQKRDGIQFQVCRNQIANDRLSNESSESCGINCTDILRTKTHTVTSTYSQTLSVAITRRSTVRPAWPPQMSQIPTYSRCGSECRKDGARCVST